jgi:hypothetical protein
MGLSRLLLLSLIASAAVSTFAAQSDPAPPVCDLSTVIPKLARHCQSDPDVPSFLLSPTAQCFEALEASTPYHSRAAAGPRLITASLDAANSYCQGTYSPSPHHFISIPHLLCFLWFSLAPPREFFVAIRLV